MKKAILLFEDATRLVSIADIFSHNENIDELATEDIQYMLLPSLLGTLTSKLTSRERKDVIDVAEVYFKDFLQRTNNYGLSNYELKKQMDDKQSEESEKSEFKKLQDSVNTRANKIQKFKEQKELKSKIADLKTNMNNEHVDDEIKRNYFISMIKLAVYDAIDELNNIEMEKPILEHMANMRKESKPKPKGPPPKPLRPIIITKDEAQKAVFGLGYPSLPTMTVQEFYDKRVKDGIFPDPNKTSSGPLSLQEAALKGVDVGNQDEEDETKEQMEESDDPELLQRLRDKDEFKDDHRRGWGNRFNRS